MTDDVKVLRAVAFGDGGTGFFFSFFFLFWKY